MKTSVSFNVHPRVLKALRKTARTTGGLDKATAEGLLMRCLATTPAPREKSGK